MGTTVKVGNKMEAGRLISVAGRTGMYRLNVIRFFALPAAVLFSCAAPLRADDTNLEEQVKLLREQNAVLQQQLQKQGDALDSLAKKVQDLEAAGGGKENPAPENSTPEKGGFNFGKVNLSGEGGVAFFNTGSDGFAPQSDFRVDEARLFVEAPVWNEVYFYSDVDLATRENNNLNLHLGELYLDFQDASQLWGRDNQFNVRAGRLNIPFGEEYLARNAIDNPLISRSVSDLWGFDPGVEIYGSLAKFSYVLAVQNGSGANGVQDFSGDKSVAARIGFDPNGHWHFSVSGMRTGDVNAQKDFTSAEWFGTGFFQSLGSLATTKFHANLVEADATARWKSGHVSAFGGYARYGDNDPAADNGRDIFYYSVEGVQNLPKKFYAAARFSEIYSDKGVPVVGYGNGADYFSALTTELWRLSLGIGYRFSDRLVIKTEYSFERGRELSGESRNHEDFFGTEADFKF
jgi:phosphate-selective porin O/P